MYRTQARVLRLAANCRPGVAARHACLRTAVSAPAAPARAPALWRVTTAGAIVVGAVAVSTIEEAAADGGVAAEALDPLRRTLCYERVLLKKGIAGLSLACLRLAEAREECTAFFVRFAFAHFAPRRVSFVGEGQLYCEGSA